MFPSGHSTLPHPHYLQVALPPSAPWCLQMGPREEEQVCTFAVIYFRTHEDSEEPVPPRAHGARRC